MNFRTVLFSCLGLFSALQPGWGIAEETREEKMALDEKKIIEMSAQIAKLYDLPPGQNFLDITERLLESSYVFQPYKDAIISSGRHVILFTYPSDGLQIKAFISYVPDAENPPLILEFRGGNKDFGLLNPANDLSTFRDCTVLSTTLRGGVSEGEDEYGGADVNDVNNLINYIPELDQKLSLHLQNQKMAMISYSRGAMEMFLALARFPELQNRVDKVVSISGTLDMRFNISDRPDMQEMFTEEFGLNESNYEEWTNLRDPLLAAANIRPDLPVLIVQGTADIRVALDEGLHMVNALNAQGVPVTYWEFEGGSHSLRNSPEYLELVFDWLK